MLFSIVLPFRVSAEEPGVKNRVEGEKRIFTIEVRDADIKDVLRGLAQQSGMGIILSRGVEGKVTFSFRDVTLREALDILLRAYNYHYSIDNNVIWVGKKGDIPQIEEELGVEVIQLNYAKASEIAGQLKLVLSEGGTVTPDNRTNKIIIRDKMANIEDAKSLVSRLDMREVQVIIEARIVEASTNFTRELGIQWGGSYTTAGGSNQATGSQVIGAERFGSAPSGRDYAVNMPVSGPTAGLGLIIGSLGSNILLDMELSAAERDGKAKIVSQPKITTLSNKPATIHSGITYRVKTTSSTNVYGGTASASTTTGIGLEEVKTGIDLTVTPQTSADGFIMLKISTTKSEPDFSRTVDGIPGVTDKSASTVVMVRDGETTVIGGLYRSSVSSSDRRVPFLSKIPFLGIFFKSTSKSSDNEELLVFITPRIFKHNKEVVF